MPCHSYNTTLISPEQNPETSKTFHENLQDTKSDEMYCRYIFVRVRYRVYRRYQKHKVDVRFSFSKETHIASSILLVN